MRIDEPPGGPPTLTGRVGSTGDLGVTEIGALGGR
jgi:hypothetical protein